MPRETVLLYLGAHQGGGLGEEIRKFSKVYAFDADPDNVLILKKKFGHHRNVEIIHGALVGDEDDAKEITFNISSNNSGSSSVGQFNEEWTKTREYKIEMVKQIKVKGISIGKWCKQRKIVFIDSYISDLQGLDLVVLRTMKEYLEKKLIERIQCETLLDNKVEIYKGMTENKLENFKKLLEPLGYEMKASGWSNLVGGQFNKVSDEHSEMDVLWGIKEEWKSQDGVNQDKVIDKLLMGQRGGVFVDIGAHNGVYISNSYFFEKSRGWTGLCVEPMPHRFKELVENRPNSKCWNGACVSSLTDTKTADFLLSTGYTEPLSGLVDKYDPRHVDRINRENKQHGGESKIIKVPVNTLENLLREFGIGRGDEEKRLIDFMSLDVEGAEYDVLVGMGERIKDVHLITIEFNYQNEESKKISEYLKKNGFVIEKIIGGGYEFIFRNKYFGLRQQRIHVATDWTSDNEIYPYLMKMSEDGKGSWGMIKIVPPGEEYDYTVVLNRPRKEVKREKTIMMPMEPMSTRSTYGEWKDSKNILYVLPRNNIEWHLGKTYQQLCEEKIEKKYENVLSTITSLLNTLEGHKKRIKFIEYIDSKLEGKNKNDFSFHFYGKDKSDLKSYKGPLKTYCKEDGLFPYKYTFASENTSEVGYFTEKLCDAILSECLCFYWGCPNISHFIDSRAYITLDLNNLEKSFEIVKKAIENNEWEKRIDIIRAEKKKILNQLQFYPTLEVIILEDLKGTLNIPHFYCISLTKRQDRRERMKNRFMRHGLADKLSFIEAATPDSKVTQYYAKGMPSGRVVMHDKLNYSLDAVHACFVSHILALKKFVESGEPEAIICEDDALLKRTFVQDYLKVRQNLPDDAPLMQLFWLPWLDDSWNSMGIHWAGKDKNMKNLCKVKKEAPWSAVMYLIRREYAIECLSKFDRPLIDIKDVPIGHRTSEMITRDPRVYLAYPVLVSEESILDQRSDIRENAMSNQLISHWGREQFFDF